MTAPKMTTTARMMLAMTPVALCAAAGSADVPGVLNHVPADSAIYAVVPDVGRLLGDLTSLNTAMAGKLPPEAAQIGMGLFFAQSIVNQPGFNQNGSAAIIVTPPEGGFDAGDPAVTALLPIEDLEAFAKAPFMAGQGASFADGMASVTMDGDTLHMRDLGEFTVAGNDKAAIEAFRAGEFIGAHTEALGVSGVHAVEGSDLMFVLSVAQLDEPIGEALAQLEQQANFLAMMGGGEQVTQGMGALKHAMETIRRDGSVIMFTADPGDAGVTLDTGVSFRPDTESAKVFDSMADSGELLGALPNENFLVAYSMDTSSEGIGSLLKMLGEMGGAQGMDMGLAAAFAQSTGASGMVGTSPAALGGAGLLSKQITYTRAANPGEAVASMSKALKEMNGQSMMGMKYTTTQGREHLFNLVLDPGEAASLSIRDPEVAVPYRDMLPEAVDMDVAVGWRFQPTEARPNDAKPMMAVCSFPASLNHIVASVDPLASGSAAWELLDADKARTTLTNWNATDSDHVIRDQDTHVLMTWKGTKGREVVVQPAADLSALGHEVRCTARWCTQLKGLRPCPTGVMKPEPRRDTGFGEWRTGLASVAWGTKRQLVWGMGILPVPPEGGAVDGTDAELLDALQAIGYVEENGK